MNFLRKNLIYLVLLIILGIIAFVPSVRTFLKDTFLPVAAVEDAVMVDESDYDVVLKGINVPDTNLKNFRNKNVVFLNFWGTWCAPCREEWPTIQKLYEARKDKVDFVLIAMMDKEESVRKFMKDNNYTAPVYIAESPINGKILPKVYPTTFLLDKNGRILMKETSSKDWNSNSVLKFIDNVTR